MNLRFKISFGVALIGIFAVVGVLLATPGAKQRRRSDAIHQMERYASQIDEATWKQADSCAGFQMVSGKSGGDLLIFMPTSSMDVRALGGNLGNSYGSINLKIVPIPNESEPDAIKLFEMAMMNPLKDDGKPRSAFSMETRSMLSAWMGALKAQINARWKKFPESKRKEAEAKLKSNLEVFRKLGSKAGFYRMKDVYMCSKDYIGVFNCTSEADKL